MISIQSATLSVYILNKNKKYPGNRVEFHASVNKGESTLLFNACLATLIFGYVAWQAILGSSANVETKDVSNMRSVVFCFHR